MGIYKTAPGFMVLLDGLRAVAVVAVILFHWTPEVKQTGLGGLGVQLFFVLSGYLITGILLEARAKAEMLGAGRLQIVKSFYARRFLRIFPLYYLVLISAALLGSYNVQQYIGWHLGYLTNVVIYMRDSWIGEASHLWSLAVEEQFYLLWPFVILFTPRRYLTATCIGFILLAPIFKLSCYYLGVGGSRLGVLPISSFQYLGAGALLALVEKSTRYRTDSYWRERFTSRIRLAGIVGLLTFAVLRFVPPFAAAGHVVAVTREFALIALFVSLTMGAAIGYAGTAGRVLSSKPMVYLGQISYGLYLFHNFIPYFTHKLLLNFNLNAGLTPGVYWMLLVNAGVLLLVSSLSWRWFESRLNVYKGRFPYVRVGKAREAVMH
ncbi:MAG: acyltransferase [Pontibacter sp.]|nr:acyltransferase [Pontibacter sp.]